jgi:CRP-like cAMP-binding protein
MPEFKKFVRFNKIDDKALKQASNYLEYKKFSKGSYIFKQGDAPVFFYGIISGKVSIRRVKRGPQRSSCIYNLHFLDKTQSFITEQQLIPKEKFNTMGVFYDMPREEITEQEIIELSEGNYFGDWGILEKRMRSASAYASEETELFLLDSKIFELTFGVRYRLFLFRKA